MLRRSNLTETELYSVNFSSAASAGKPGVLEDTDTCLDVGTYLEATPPPYLSQPIIIA